MVSVKFLFLACQNQEELTIFKKPSIETVSAFSTSDATSEIIFQTVDVFSTLAELGVVWSDKTSPTVSDNLKKVVNIDVDGITSFKLENLQKGKTYYVRAFYKLNNDIVYGNELSWSQTTTGSWQRLSSPELKPEEYMYHDDAQLGYNGNYMFTYKVNSFSNAAVSQFYDAEVDRWNPKYNGLGSEEPKSFPLLFNPIRATYKDNSNVTLTLYGGGHYILPRGNREYQSSMYILESNGNWEPYPGASVPNTSFGINKLVYVIENLPKGKLWVFDYGDLSWKVIGTFPYANSAHYVGFDMGERFFALVEPAENDLPTREFYEYIVKENKWKRLADFTGPNRRNGTPIIVNNRLFYGLGKDPNVGLGFRDIWEYNINQNTWQRASDYPGAGTVDLLARESNNRALVGFGRRVNQSSVGGETYRSAVDFWQFMP